LKEFIVFGRQLVANVADKEGENCAKNWGKMSYPSSKK